MALFRLITSDCNAVMKMNLPMFAVQLYTTCEFTTHHHFDISYENEGENADVSCLACVCVCVWLHLTWEQNIFYS